MSERERTQAGGSPDGRLVEAFVSKLVDTDWAWRLDSSRRVATVLAQTAIEAGMRGPFTEEEIEALMDLPVGLGTGTRLTATLDSARAKLSDSGGG